MPTRLRARTLRIARFFGVDVLVEVRLLVLLVGVAVFAALARPDPWVAVDFLLWVLMVGTAVLVHEAGHVAMARWTGLRVGHVTLGWLHAAAYTARPRTPKEEIAVALSGPVASLGFAAISLALPTSLRVASITAEHVFGVNAAMGLVNLLPAFPLDGGRVLRALLSMRWGVYVAVSTARRIRQWIGLCLLGSALLPMPWPLRWMLPALGATILALGSVVERNSTVP